MTSVTLHVSPTGIITSTQSVNLNDWDAIRANVPHIVTAWRILTDHTGQPCQRASSSSQPSQLGP